MRADPAAYGPHRRRGIALLLVLLSIALTVILSVTFLVGQSTSAGISVNVTRHARARVIAESAMASIVAQIQANNDWRDTHVNGVWLTNQSLNGGTYSVTVEDGEDTNGDGTVDGDGDLADDNNDKVTVTITSRFEGASHVLKVVVTPGQTALGPINLLMVVDHTGSLTAAEDTRKDLIESWGWTVGLIAASATQDEFNAAISGIHVVYVPDDGGSNIIGSRLASASVGVVYEDGDMNDEFHLSSEQASYTGATIRIVDTTHYITRPPFVIGDLVIASSSARMECPSGSVSSALRPLAWFPNTTSRVVAPVEAGSTLSDGSSAPGRRCVSPFAGFMADNLTEDGQLLLKRMLEWGAQTTTAHDTVIPISNWITGTTVNLASGEDRLLVTNISCETLASISSVTYGYQPMTLAISSFESTGVGNRNNLYYMREAHLQAATDNRIRVTWTSGGRDDETVASRLYKHVSQSTPLRVTDATTNASASPISSNAMTVSNGDYVFSGASNGQPLYYDWVSPLVEGTDNRGSTSGHTTADFAVTGNPGTVTATADAIQSGSTVPNRQTLVSAVIQPRANSAGNGVIAQLLALYEFSQQQPSVDLIGRWTFDDPGKGGAMIIQDTIALNDSAYLDGYNGQTGAYSGTNINKDIILVTNTGSSSGISLSGTAKIWGTTYNQPGSNPTTVVNLGSTAVITGSRYEQSTSFTFPTLSAPTGMPSNQGNITWNSSRTISTDQRFDDLTISGSSTVITISGNVRIQVGDDFTMSGGRIYVTSGSHLTLYVADDATFSGTSTVVNTVSNSSSAAVDTTAAGKVDLIFYGDNSDVTMSNSATICGSVYVKRDLTLSNSAVIYGAVYVGDDLILSNTSAIHVDLNLPGYAILPVADATGNNNALAHGGVSFAQSGAIASTSNAFQFDGSNDFVQIPHHDLYLLDHATFSFWFRSTNLSGNHALISKDSSGYDAGGHFHVWTQGTSLKAQLQTNGSSPYGTGNDFVVTASGLATNTWYHVAVTLGAGGLRLYLNGSLVDTIAYPGGLGASSGGIGNYQALIVGAGTTTAGDLTHLPLNEYFAGKIDDLRIYNGVLDATQISRIHAGNDPGDRTAPGYVVQDTSGNGQELNLFIDSTDAVTWAADGGLTLNSATVIRAPSSPDKILNGATATGQFSIEVIAVPASTGGSATRMLWYGPSSGSSDCNIDLWQEGTRNRAKVRSSTTADSPPTVTSDTGLAVGTQYHLLLTYNGEEVRIYRDGAQVASLAQTGNLLNWNTAYGLTLANLPQGGSAWLGTFKRLAVYDRALNQIQIDNVVQGLPPGDGSTVAEGVGHLKWCENP
ncbi:MAG: LamG domain-containing protein [Phycisphaeraceae bacterium]|nr:LamG domain-containing protein [Phycisphaeraceae bacterium]